MNIRTNFEDYARSLDIDPVEAALMDVSRAIQITVTMHREAEAHYRGLASHVDRPGSPLEDLVHEIYASGSFAIHAPTRSRLKRDQHDVDAVIELSVLPDSDPEWVLTTLNKAIKGDPGSKYHGYLIEKNSRCVTVTYPDGVTVDLMPVVRLAGTPNRVATLFHHKPETGTCYHKEVNPKGFADHFNDHIETSAVFQDRFDARRFLVDGETYETMAKRMASDGGMIKADTQPMPVHVPLDQKSPRVVALQLIKRFRDKRFRKHDDHRGKRPPPQSSWLRSRWKLVPCRRVSLTRSSHWLHECAAAYRMPKAACSCWRFAIQHILPTSSPTGGLNNGVISNCGPVISRHSLTV